MTSTSPASMEASSCDSCLKMDFLLDGGGETDVFKLETSGAARRLAGCALASSCWSWLSWLQERFILSIIWFHLDVDRWKRDDTRKVD